MIKGPWIRFATFCLSPILLTVMAAVNQWNPDTAPMIIRVNYYYLSGRSGGQTLIPPASNGGLIESNQPCGDYDSVNFNPPSISGAFSLGSSQTPLDSSGLSYSGSVV